MSVDKLWIIAAAVVILLLVISVIQLVLIRRRKRLELQYQDIERNLGDEEQYRRVVDESRSYRHIRHDLKKQERVMEMVTDGTGITKYTGNIVLDSVLTQEYSDAVACGIVMDIDVADEFEVGLSDKEIVSLFANLLDNAREACERCGKSDSQKFLKIAISIRVSGSRLLISVENSKSENEHPDVDEMKTSKPDKENHGYGVAIIRDIVDRHNGEIYMRDEEGMFCTKISMSVENQEETECR